MTAGAHLMPADRDATARLWRAFLLSAVVVMFGAFLFRIPYDFWRLAFEPKGHSAASDLRFRFVELHAWFAGNPVYGAIESADYPPASYVILLPLVGWPTFEIARLLAVVSMAAALAWLCALSVRGAGSIDRNVRLFALLVPLSMYATTATVRIGQLGVYLMAFLLAGILLLAERERTWKSDLLAAVLLAGALVKPTFSVPFMWIAFFRGGLRPTILIPGLYVLLTLVAAAFQDASLPMLIQGWLGQSAQVDFRTGHANVYTWLGMLGLEKHLLAGSILVLLASGLWTWWYRRGDIWILLGVAAIVARIWSWHHWYDDILLLVPLITLVRMATVRRSGGRADWIAMALLGLIWAFGIAPYEVRNAPPPWGDLFKIAKATTWLATLGLLLVRVRREPSREAC